jgi:hypothetical protein
MYASNEEDGMYVAVGASGTMTSIVRYGRKCVKMDGSLVDWGWRTGTG